MNYEKNIMTMTRKEFEEVPDRSTWDATTECDSLVLIPTRERHDSGFRIIAVVACNKNQPICKVTQCSDVVHIEGIGGLGYRWSDKGGVPKEKPPTDWSIDCLPKSGLFRLFTKSGILAGRALSSFECWERGRR